MNMQLCPSLGTNGANAEEENELVQPCWLLLLRCPDLNALLPCCDGRKCLDPRVKTLLSPFSHSCMKAIGIPLTQQACFDSWFWLRLHACECLQAVGLSATSARGSSEREEGLHTL